MSGSTKTQTTVRSTGAVSSSEFDDPNRKGVELGLRVNLRIAIPVFRDSKAILDGSYLFGVTDLNKSGTAEDKTQEILLLVGYQIPFGGPAFATAEPAPKREETSVIGDSTSALAVPVEPASEPSPTPSPSTKPKTKTKKEKRK